MFWCATLVVGGFAAYGFWGLAMSFAMNAHAIGGAKYGKAFWDPASYDSEGVRQLTRLKRWLMGVPIIALATLIADALLCR